MPPQIAALPRSDGGLPVPFVAQWSSEEEMYLRREPLAEGKVAAFTKGSRGEGQPVFGVMDVERQRLCVMKCRCQVCGGSARERLLADGQGLGQSTVYDGAPRRMLLEPWVCASCLAYALRVCPGLIRLRHGARLHVLQVERALPVAVLTRLGGNLAGREAIGYIKILVERAARSPADEWLAAQSSLREAV